jgi:putative oxidoreductase
LVGGFVSEDPSFPRSLEATISPTHELTTFIGHTMSATYATDPQMLGIGLLVARLVLGLLMAAHGAQKLFGWFGGYGLNATGEFMVQLGFPSGRAFASAASVGEIVSGLLVALGLLGPIGPALMISVMIVAAITVHWKNGVFATQNGIELPLLYATGALAMALAGFGPFSLDALLGITTIWTPRVVTLVLAIGVAGGLANLVIRRSPVAAGGASQ